MIYKSVMIIIVMGFSLIILSKGVEAFAEASQLYVGQVKSNSSK